MSRFDQDLLEYEQQNPSPSGTTQDESDNRILGFREEPVLQPGYDLPSGEQRPPWQRGDEVQDVPIFANDVRLAVQEMSTADQGWLAIDMYFNVPGAYGANPEDIYLEDGVTLNPVNFHNAIMHTVDSAEVAGSAGYNVTPMFLDILQGKNMSRAELTAALAARRAEIEADKSKGTGGRVINYIHPAGLVKAAHAGASSTLGRKASKAEAAKFVKEIHNLQASGASSMDVRALSEEAARRNAPNEAAAMDHVGAARLVMQAIGGGVR